MQQITDWLQKLGLEQYVQRFAENDINFVILPDLTDQDLEKIGVASLGHRRQLLRAIAELKGAPEPCTVATAPVAPHDTAERRQVTVMFSDLVGSTALLRGWTSQSFKLLTSPDNSKTNPCAAGVSMLFSWTIPEHGKSA